jgi:VanZ family protein
MTPAGLRHRGAWIAAAVLWMAFAVWVGQRPATALPQIGIRIPFMDKGAHFVMYGVLGALVASGLRPAHRRAALVAALVAAVTGGIDEGLQGVLQRGRSPELLDWLADVLGALAGGAAAVRWWKAREEQGGEPPGLLRRQRVRRTGSGPAPR